MSDLIQIQVKKRKLDLDTLKSKLKSSKGEAYWRSLEELAEHPEVQERMAREFPTAPRDMAPVSRRDFMKFMGATVALAGLSGCAFQPQEKIVPYVKTPDDLIPGIPQFYATAYNFGGFAQGVLAESNMGRPTKIEGNPDHPDSGGQFGSDKRGTTDVWMQSYILDLYDPARSQNILLNGSVATWDQFLGAMQDKVNGGGTLGETNAGSVGGGVDGSNQIPSSADPSTPRLGNGGFTANGGQGLRLLTGTITSPALLDLINSMKRRFPQAQWHQYEPVNADNVHEGARLAFGRALQPLHDLSKADVILSLDANFLYDEPNHLAMARDWSNRRRVRSEGRDKLRMNRVYMAESAPTVTGIKAEHRMPMRHSQIEAFARAVAAQMGVPGFEGAMLPQGVNAKVVSALVADLQGARGRSVVMAGYAQSPAVHAIAHAMNAQLGNAGQTVSYIEPVITNSGSQVESLRALVNDMNAGRVDTLLIFGANPCYDAPSDINFLSAIQAKTPSGAYKVPMRVHVGAYEDETAAWCQWHVPEAHPLEAWGDLRAYDGTISIVQPLIEPIYPAARSYLEVLAPFSNNPLRGAYDLVRSSYLKRDKEGAQIGATDAFSGQGSIGFEKKWQTIIHDGFVRNTASKPVSATVRPGFASGLTTATPFTPGPKSKELQIRPDPCVWDGRYSNNAWLQEMPKPLSKLTWDNAALMSVKTAQELGLDTESTTKLSVSGKSIDAAVFVMPGHPDDAITLYLGYGRARGGPLGGDTGNEVGFNAYALRTSGGMYHAPNCVVAASDKGTYQLARTDFYNLIDAVNNQGDFRNKVDSHIIGVAERQAGTQIDGQHGRELIRGGTLAEFVANEHAFVPEDHRNTLPLMPTYLAPNQYKEYSYTGDPKNKPVLPEHNGVASEEVRENGKERELQVSLYPRDVDQQNRFRDPKLNLDQEKDPEARPYGWGMSIDLNTCMGCNACVQACVSENNIATVGKEQVAMGRLLHWIRIDTYYKGDFVNPEATFQPVMCMHCEKAPCEPVCPVNAAVHSYEGINEQIYNRCIGTRYCANNCPYKVRRFNYLQYSEQDSATIMLMHNPEVTVRSRGVMEKCNFCIQRVNWGKWQAQRENRQIRDGEITTACQQVCPTNAIVFGNINDPDAQVRKLKEEPHDYGMLTDLNTYPRVTYLAKVDNPNENLPYQSGAVDAGENHQGGASRDSKGGGHAGGKDHAALPKAELPTTLKDTKDSNHG